MIPGWILARMRALFSDRRKRYQTVLPDEDRRACVSRREATAMVNMAFSELATAVERAERNRNNEKPL